MSLLESAEHSPARPRAKKKLTKRARAKRALARRENRRKREDAADLTNNYQVMTIPVWCRLNCLSIANGKKLLREGKGPKVVQLSPRRVGIRVIDNAEWQESRAR